MTIKNPFSRGRKPARGTQIVKRTRRDGGYDLGYYNGTNFILINGTTANGSDYIYGTDKPSGIFDGTSIVSDNKSGSDQGYTGGYSDPASASGRYLSDSTPSHSSDSGSSYGSDSSSGGYSSGGSDGGYSGGYSSGGSDGGYSSGGSDGGYSGGGGYGD